MTDRHGRTRLHEWTWDSHGELRSEVTHHFKASPPV